MGVAADIARSLREGPAPAVREHLARGAPEARSLAFLMLGCFFVVIAQLPALAREVAAAQQGLAASTPLAASLPPEFRSLDTMLAYTILPWLVVVPLVFYGLAALAHALSRALGGRGTPAGARLAMFWSWLAAAPLALLAGALGGFFGSGAANLFGILWIAVFAAFWWLSQREAARGPAVHGA